MATAKRQTPAQVRAEYEAKMQKLQASNEALTKDNASLDSELKRYQSGLLQSILGGGDKEDGPINKTRKQTLFHDIIQGWDSQNERLSHLTERLEAFTERAVGEGSAHKTSKIKTTRSFHEAAEQNLGAMQTSLLRLEELVEMLDQIG